MAIVWNYWPLTWIVPWPIRWALNLLIWPIQLFFWPTQVIWNFVPDLAGDAAIAAFLLPLLLVAGAGSGFIGLVFVVGGTVLLLSGGLIALTIALLVEVVCFQTTGVSCITSSSSSS